VIRLACINLPELPLQLLIQQNPAWQKQPAAVVDEDKASGIILWANEHARANGILPGMRYAAALSLSPDLRGDVIRTHMVEEAVQQLTIRLDHFSPGVEPCANEPGVFWLDAQGLLPLYPSWAYWLRCIENNLREAGFFSVIAAGFTRFGTYAATKSDKNLQDPAQEAPEYSVLFTSPEEERTFIRDVPLNRLNIRPWLRDALHKLGIDDLGPFADLPAEGVRKRFGREAYELHCSLNKHENSDALPLQPSEIRKPIASGYSLENPEQDLERILNGIEQLLRKLLDELALQNEALRALELTLTLDSGKTVYETLRPAGYTRKLKRILPLVRMRLETLSLHSGVVDLHLCARSVRVSTRQLDLLEQNIQRDVEAAHRAFAEIRAELGNEAVVHARLHDRHLPEARFSWDPIEQLLPARHISSHNPPLIRRLYIRPRSLPRPLNVKEVIGPHFVSGAWWSRDIARAYYYLHAEDDQWLWVYKDQRLGRWFLHGEAQ